MKNVVKKLLLTLLIICFVGGMTACFDDSADNGSADKSGKSDNGSISAIYDLYVEKLRAESKTPLSYDEWLATIKGERGERGIQGEKGEKGDRGEQGIQGEKGEKGDKGERGIQGEKGEKGDRGEQGIQGEKGDKGDSGRGILKIELIDGDLWVTYTDNPNEKYNLGNVIPKEDYILEYYLLEDDTYGVRGGKNIAAAGVVEIPSEYKGKKVTRILSNAFKEVVSLKKVIIPETVVRIEDNAFYACEKLESLNISSPVAEVGVNAFYGCTELTANIALNTENVGEYAFYNCAKITVSIGSAVKTIGEYAFYGCNSDNISFEDEEKWASSMMSKFTYELNFNPSMAGGKVYTCHLYPSESLAKLISSDVTAKTVDYNDYWLGTGKYTSKYSTFSLYTEKWIKN